jgi:hypothetical protein
MLLLQVNQMQNYVLDLLSHIGSVMTDLLQFRKEYTMSSPIGLLTGKMTGALTALGHVHTVSAIKDFFMGNSSKDDAPEEIQALIGLFGLGDEIGFKRALLKMSKESQAIITSFIEWHFLSHEDDGPLGGLIAWYKLNKWREVVVKLDAPTVKKGETKIESVDRPGKGQTGPTTTSTEMKYDFAAGEEHTLKFLRKLVRLIKEGSVPGKDAKDKDQIDWVPGYKKAVAFCAASGMATINDSSILKWLDDILKSIPDHVLASPKKLKDYINRKHALRINARAADQSWSGRLKAFIYSWL